MKLAITSQNLDHAPDAIRALRAQRTRCDAPNLRRADVQTLSTMRDLSGLQDAYAAAISDCLARGDSPVCCPTCQVAARMLHDNTPRY